MDIRHTPSRRLAVPRRRGSGVHRILGPLVLATLLQAGSVVAQESHDIYLAEIHETEQGVAVRDALNLTRRQGYDNQPAFSPDGKTLYYTSQRGTGEAQQTDIWHIDLSSEPPAPQALFESSTSEYSPTPVPGSQALSVIRVEEDGKQKLWLLPLGSNAQRRVLDKIEPVGYHAWSGTELVLFVLAEPHQLQRVDGSAASNDGRIIAHDIGRALHKIPGRDAFSFVHKTEDGWWIKSLEVETDRMAQIIRPRGEREDYTWSPDGALWMSDGESFFRFRPGVDKDWTKVEQSADGPGGITRLTVSPDGRHLAFVAASAPAPETEEPPKAEGEAESQAREDSENDGDT